MKTLKEHCGIFGIFNNSLASRYVYYGLYALQHRGQEAAGIVTAQIGKQMFYHHRELGLVTKVFEEDELFTQVLRGNIAIGHNRYSTAGDSDNKCNIQPLIGDFKGRTIAIAHNGNISNANSIRKHLADRGYVFDSNSDTEVIIHLLNETHETNLIEALKKSLLYLEGAFSLLIMTNDSLIAVRDSKGFRPLCIGKVGDSYCFASETCALDLVSAEFIAEVEPGQIHEVNTEGYFIHTFKQDNQLARCIFEYIYFSRPDSIIFGNSVDKIRRKFGQILAHEAPIPKCEEEIIVINVPDSSNIATVEYVQECQKLGYKCRLELALIRNHYIGRTFIMPHQGMRVDRLKLKFNPVKEILKDRVVVLVDDSIVRGNTSRTLVSMIRNAGAKEVHFRITSPPIVDACYYGMNFPKKSELIAYQMQGNIEKIREFLNVDSLAYLSKEGLFKAVGEVYGINESYCSACFTGKHPYPVPAMDSQEFSLSK